MHRLLAKLFGIREDERVIALLMAVYHFVLLITLYLLKPVRDSLFLSGRGPDELPFVFILTTFAIIPVAGLYSRAGQALRLGPLINGVSLFLAGGIIALRLVVDSGAEWTLYLLYVCVSIYGILVTSQFWLLANALFSASQAKRVFTMLSVGAILGGIAGGEITGLLVEEVGMHSLNLLWVCAALLTASLLLVNWIRYRYDNEVDRTSDEETEDGPRGLAAAFTLLRGSTHLQFIVALIAVAVITTAFIDFQFKTVATRAYPSEDDLTSFLGRFYSRVSIVALIAQFVIAPRLMRVLGVGGALSILPLALAVGAAGMLIIPGLIAGVLLRGTDQSLRHSIDKTGRELLFVPVDLETKKRVKVFIDLFVDEGVHGIGGALLIFFTVYLDLGVQELSVVVLALLVLWAGLAYGARQSYIEQFRQKLREQEDFEPEPRVEEEDDQTSIPSDLDALLKSLCSQNERQVHNALDQLEEGTRTVPVDIVRCLLAHESADVRAHTVRMLTNRSISGMGMAVADLLTDHDPDVQLQAARYLYCDYRGDRLERLQNVLHHPDPRIRAAAVGLIAEDGGEEERELLSEALVRDLVDDAEVGPEGRVHVASLLGTVDHEWRDRMLIELLEDDHPQVVRQAVESAGRTQARSFVNYLISFLSDDRYEDEAADALAAYGDRTLGTLHDYMVDGDVDVETRVRIPVIMAATPTQLTVDVLVHSLNRVTTPVRNGVIRALSKLHAADDSFTFNASVIEKAIQNEVEHYAALRQIARLIRRGKLNGSSATTDQLRRCCEEALERIFRLLGLRYDQRDIYTAYLGLTGNDASLKASAVEFVDNLVEWSTSRYLMPLLDDPDDTQARVIGRRFFDLSLRNEADVRRYIEQADDPRLLHLFEEDPVPDIYGDGSPVDDADAEVPRVSQRDAT